MGILVILKAALHADPDTRLNAFQIFDFFLVGITDELLKRNRTGIVSHFPVKNKGARPQFLHFRFEDMAFNNRAALVF